MLIVFNTMQLAEVEQSILGSEERSAQALIICFGLPVKAIVIDDNISTQLNQVIYCERECGTRTTVYCQRVRNRTCWTKV
jgi:hypothetical protein